MTSGNLARLEKSIRWQACEHTVRWSWTAYLRVHGTLWETFFLLPFLLIFSSYESCLLPSSISSFWILMIWQLSNSAPRYSWHSENSSTGQWHRNDFSYCYLLTESKGFVCFLNLAFCLMRLVTIPPTGVPHLYKHRGKYRALFFFFFWEGGWVLRGKEDVEAQGFVWCLFW